MSESITIVGTITEPEQKQASFGPVTTFRLGTSHRKRDPQTGTWSDGPTSWYRVSVYRALGEHAFTSLRKGERVIVTGRLRLSTWENDAGRGMAADIDADAVGHDLLWGTTRYSRVAGGSSASTNANSSDERPSGQEASEWAPPMSHAGDQSSDPVSAEWVEGEVMEDAQSTPF